MRIFYITIAISLALFAQSQQKEIQKELVRLENLQKSIEVKIKKDKKILAKIEKEKEALEKLQKRIDQQINELQKERYKKLAKDFASMDPEYAGEKLSKLDPKIAAYILYNMNARKAGDALNYVDAKMVAKITKILTQLRENEKK